MVDAVSIAEQRLSRAYAMLAQRKGGPQEKQARLEVAAAEAALELAKAPGVGADTRQCHGRPMIWVHGEWACAEGHE